MKTKYFRFLYFGRKECLLHIGEVEDTQTGEKLSFLYLDGSGREMNRSEKRDKETAAYGDKNEREDVQAVYPEKADVLIVGDTSENTEKVLDEILEKVTVNQVIYPQSDSLKSVIGQHTIGAEIGLKSEAGKAEFQMISAGWDLRAVCLEEGSVVLLHGLGQRGMFDDCVMNVSVLDGKEHFGWWNEEDGFAAAMRCTVHHDYDACRYEGNREDGEYRLSVLLYGKTHLERCMNWMDSLEDDCRLGRELRFLTLPTEETGEMWEKNILNWIPEGYKCYYVCKPGEPAGEAMSQICRKSPYQIPAVTGEGIGLCCAGFLKYAEE